VGKIGKKKGDLTESVAVVIEGDIVDEILMGSVKLGDLIHVLCCAVFSQKCCVPFCLVYLFFFFFFLVVFWGSRVVWFFDELILGVLVQSRFFSLCDALGVKTKEFRPFFLAWKIKR